jgi:chemotaxis protein methyltransferase CheR
MHLRWRGFSNVRSQVCKRLGRRWAELGLAGLSEYQRYLGDNPAEWSRLAELCRVTITRFGRDRGVWQRLTQVELPRLAERASAEGRPSLVAWSAGCAGGEEPYTLSIAWQLAVAPHWPAIRLDVLATDVDDEELERATAGCYPGAVLKELSAAWRSAAFDIRDGLYCVRPELRTGVQFLRHDVRDALPAGAPFDLVLCRNLAFTYFDESLQGTVAGVLRGALRSGGVLVVGAHESVPEGVAGLSPAGPSIYWAQ